MHIYTFYYWDNQSNLSTMDVEAKDAYEACIMVEESLEYWGVHRSNIIGFSATPFVDISFLRSHHE